MTGINCEHWIGLFIEKRCPKCGAQMLGNKVGNEWCSAAECDHGCEDIFKELGLYQNNQPQGKEGK